LASKVADNQLIPRISSDQPGPVGSDRKFPQTKYLVELRNLSRFRPSKVAHDHLLYRNCIVKKSTRLNPKARALMLAPVFALLVACGGGAGNAAFEEPAEMVYSKPVDFVPAATAAVVSDTAAAADAAMAAEAAAAAAAGSAPANANAAMAAATGVSGAAAAAGSAATAVTAVAETAAGYVANAVTPTPGSAAAAPGSAAYGAAAATVAEPAATTAAGVDTAAAAAQGGQEQVQTLTAPSVATAGAQAPVAQ
jgi:hypothetical protein